MENREKILFERLLCLAANEYGKTRDEMLAWLNDDTEDWQREYPKHTSAKSSEGVAPFVQVARTSTIYPYGTTPLSLKMDEFTAALRSWPRPPKKPA